MEYIYSLSSYSDGGWNHLGYGELADILALKLEFLRVGEFTLHIQRMQDDYLNCYTIGGNN